MKNIIITLIAVLMTTTAIWAQSDKALPTLRGDEAVNQLKQNGQYDSLMEAVKASRQKNGQPEEPPMQNAARQTAKLLASNGAAGDFFGYSVAISGDTAIVGAFYDDIGANANQGSAYVFTRNGTTWTQQQQLTASDGAANDEFGISVAISGNTAIVGAWVDTVGANANQGSAYVFTRNGTTWTQQQKLTATGGTAYDRFGVSIAISGDTAIVGAYRDDVGANVDQGSAYVFTRSGATWTQQQRLTASDGAVNDDFGISVAISGETAIIGAYSDDVAVNTDQGSAYVFTRTRDGTTWTQQQRLTASDGATNDRFGFSVAISGNTAIVGAWVDDVAVNTNQGSAYVFTRSGTTWTQQAQFLASDGAAGDNFGVSVAISGDTAIVGAYLDDVGANTNQGSAYVFTRNGTTWTQQQQLTASDGAANDNFGNSVAISGNTAIVGAWVDTVGANSLQQGSAYVFDLTIRPQFDFDGDGKADISVFRPSNGAWYLNRSTAGFTGVSFGQQGDLITPADFDGDGRTDIAVYRGGIWYLLRSTLGFTSVQFGLPTDIPQPADFDCDGKAELVVYRPSNGVWYVFNLVNSNFSSVQFGLPTDKAVVGDYDGDSRADYAVYRPSNGVWYLLQSTNGFTGTQFGIAEDKPVVGDYDGDGRADIAVYRPSNGVWYLLRSSQGFTAFQFGIATDLPTPADYDGDGQTDIAVYREGIWYLQNSTNGFTSIQFGLPNDKPIPNAYVP